MAVRGAEVDDALVRICDLAGRPRGTGFLADGGTMVTSHEAVDGLARLVLHAAGDQVCLVEAEAITALPEAGLALVATEGLTVPPLPIAPGGPAHPDRRIRLRLPQWTEGVVVGTTAVTYTATDRFHLLEEVYELDLDGTDMSRVAPQASGAPLIDAATGAVLAVVVTALHSGHRVPGGFAVPLRAVDGRPAPLAELLARNAATVPAYGPHLNLAGALQLTGTSVGSAAGAGEWREPVSRTEVADELREFLALRGEAAPLVLGLVGDPGTGRSTELAELAARRARGPLPAPTVWLRGAELRPGDGGIKDAVERALRTAARIVGAAGGRGGGAGGEPLFASPDAVAELARTAGRPLLVLLDAPEEMPPVLAHALPDWTAGTASWLRAGGVRLVVACRAEYWEQAGALLPAGMLRSPAVPSQPAPGAPARALPPCLRLGDLSAEQAERARTRYALELPALAPADAAHPLSLRLLSEIRASLPEGAEPAGGPPSRVEIFAAHLDLVCLRIAVRLAAAAEPPVRGTGVKRLAARVAGQVHEAARRCLGPGQGELDREAFEDLFPWRTGWASAVLTEGLLVPAGAGYRFAHEELADWLQGLHLDLAEALHSLVHRWFAAPAGRTEAPVRLPSRPAARAGHPPPVPPAPSVAPPSYPRSLPVPHHRVGPVIQSMLRTTPTTLTPHLHALIHALTHPTSGPEAAVGGAVRPAPGAAPTATGGGVASPGDRAAGTAAVSGSAAARAAMPCARPAPGTEASAGGSPGCAAASADAGERPVSGTGVHGGASTRAAASCAVPCGWPVPAAAGGRSMGSLAAGTGGAAMTGGGAPPCDRGVEGLAAGGVAGAAAAGGDAWGESPEPGAGAGADASTGSPAGRAAAGDDMPHAQPAPGAGGQLAGMGGDGPAGVGVAAGAAVGGRAASEAMGGGGDAGERSGVGAEGYGAGGRAAAGDGGGLPGGAAGVPSRGGDAEVDEWEADTVPTPRVARREAGAPGEPAARRDAPGPRAAEPPAGQRVQPGESARQAVYREAGARAAEPPTGPGGQPGGFGGRGAYRRDVGVRAAQPEAGRREDATWWAARLLGEVLLRVPDAAPYRGVLRLLAERITERSVECGGFGAQGTGGLGEFGPWFWRRVPLPLAERLELLRLLLPADPPPVPGEPGDPEARFLPAVAELLCEAPREALPAVCGWFADDRPLQAAPGADAPRLTVASAAQALLHTHRRRAVDDLTEALVAAGHPGADEVLAALAEDEPSAVCRAVDRWAHDPRADRHVAAASYGRRAAPFVRSEADRELLRYAALAILARPGDCTLHGAALGLLVRDPATRSRHLAAALAHFATGDPQLSADALAAAFATHPEPVLAAFQARLREPGEPGEGTADVLCALAGVTTPALARRAAAVVQDHLLHRPEGAPQVARYLDLRLEQGPGVRAVLLPLAAVLLHDHPAEVRRALIPVLAAPGSHLSRPLRQELLDMALDVERDHTVLDALLTAASDGCHRRSPVLTRDLVHRLGLILGRTPEGAAHFDRRIVELARSCPDFTRLLREWLGSGSGWDALIGPSARRRLDTVA